MVTHSKGDYKFTTWKWKTEETVTSADEAERLAGLGMINVHDAITVMHETRDGGSQTTDMIRDGP